MKITSFHSHKISLLVIGLAGRLMIVLPLTVLLWLAVWGVLA